MRSTPVAVVMSGPAPRSLSMNDLLACVSACTSGYFCVFLCEGEE